MSATINNTHLNLTPSALFPNKQGAAEDKKCLIISKIYQDIAAVQNLSDFTQNSLNENAQKRYEFLSVEQRLSLPDADHRAFLLYQQGVKHETAKEYYSCRLSESDAKCWVILVAKF